MNIHIIQHALFENEGIITEWALKKKHRLSYTHIYKNEIFPKISNIDFLIILGGAMGAYEEYLYPWLKTEKKYIEDAIKSNKIVLGICLGAQLIANVLGAKVFPHKNKEIGWWNISSTLSSKQNKFFNAFPESYTAFHWHGDTFDLPQSATLMASSGATTNQAFVYGNNVVGLQFHFEITESLLKSFLRDGEAELKKSIYVQTPDEITAGFHHLKQSNRLMMDLLQNLTQ
jgi:GMP synthase (glutamine-hydrolysing)